MFGLPYVMGEPTGRVAIDKWVNYLPSVTLPAASAVMPSTSTDDVEKIKAQGWQDKYGQWHYGDQPPINGVQQIKNSPNRH